MYYLSDTYLESIEQAWQVLTLDFVSVVFTIFIYDQYFNEHVIFISNIETYLL
jgi:hypothetical protein